MAAVVTVCPGTGEVNLWLRLYSTLLRPFRCVWGVCRVGIEQHRRARLEREQPQGVTGTWPPSQKGASRHISDPDAPDSDKSRPTFTSQVRHHLD